MLKKFHSVPNHEKYGINVDGHVINLDTCDIIKPLKKNEKYYFIIDGEEIESARLSLITFIGEFPSAIIYKFRTEDFDIKSVAYGVSDIHISENTLRISGIEFVKLKNYNDYFISRSGIVYSKFYNKFLRRSFNHRGYPTITLIDNNGHRSPRKVHRLVYETFIGELDKTKVIDHVNGKKWCCFDWNLEQITQRENVQRAYETGQNPCRHWSDAQIHAICKMIENNSSIHEILKALDLKDSYKRKLSMIIHLIRKKGYFKEISQYYNLDNYCMSVNKASRVLTPHKVMIIKNRLLDESVSIKELADSFGCTTSTITKIRDNKTWKDI